MSQPRTYAGRSAVERTAERRGRLVDATIALLAEQGEARTTMTAICAGAGLTERYFYESFAARDDALVAAFEQVCALIVEATVAAVQAAVGEADVRLRAAIGALVDLVTARPEIGLVAIRESTTSPALRARRHDLLADFANLAATEASELYGADAWAGESARLRGLVLAAGIGELIGWWQAGRTPATRDELVAVAADLFAVALRRTGR